MALTKYKLGELLEQSDERNTDENYGIDDVRGISIQKKFIFTKADMTGVSLRPYKLVRPNTFAYVTVTSRNGEKITLGYNDTADTYIVSSSYIVFRVVDEAVLLPEYLFIYFNRPEFDRFARFNSWGSARETFDWDTMCDIDIELPSVEIQQKFVDVYKAMLANQKCYENGLSNLKLTCDAYIEDLRRKMPCEKIGPYIQQSDRRNDIGLTQDDVRGISIEKKFIFTKADMTGVNVANPKYVDGYFISSNNIIIESKNKQKLSTKYLYYFVISKEKHIYVETPMYMYPKFDASSFNTLKIPVPPLEKQKEIVEKLDKFNEMCNEISDGLPLEIELRKKQKKYILNKLLNI